MTKNMERRTFLEAAIAIVPLVALGQSLTPQTSARPVKIEAIIEQRKLRRKVHGMAAALMPFAADGQVAVEAFQNHLLVTHHAGLVNAVNRDTGYVNYAEIAERGAEVRGVDRSEEMISQARKKFPALKFEALDARELRFNAEFDAVFSNAVLHWIPEAKQVIAGVAHALKPGGRFVAEFGGKGNIQRLVEGFHRAFLALGMREPDGVSPWFYPSVGEYAGLLERHGLEVREASLFDRPTRLEEGEHGLENWIRLFRQTFLEKMGEENALRWIREVERQCRVKLFKNGSWELDYRRLRIAAWKA